MLFDENDIDFSKISPTEFEELCFDLLFKLGFHDLSWRQGGADSGRDIEAYFSIANPLVGNYTEKWFIECKHHSSGVPVEKLMSKIAWADAEKPQHLAFMVTSYLTNPAKDWLKAIQNDKPYSIHIIEGKQLKSLILGFQPLIDRYFIDKYLKLLTELRRNWIVLDILPDHNAIYLLHKQISLEKLSPTYVAFFWCLWHMNLEELEEKEATEELPFSSEYELKLCSHTNYQTDVLEKYEHIQALQLKRLYITLPDGKEYNHLLTSPMLLREDQESFPGLYCLKADSDDTGIEILIEGKSELSAKIRRIPTNIQSRFAEVENSCVALWKIESTWDMRKGQQLTSSKRVRPVGEHSNVN